MKPSATPTLALAFLLILSGTANAASTEATIGPCDNFENGIIAGVGQCIDYITTPPTDSTSSGCFHGGIIYAIANGVVESLMDCIDYVQTLICSSCEQTTLRAL